MWLENYLAAHKKILLMVSHSQDFLNNVCTNIITIQSQKIVSYAGNYDTVHQSRRGCCAASAFSTTHTKRATTIGPQYRQTREEIEENQMKRYNWEQDQIKHMKDYIARFGHGSAKLAKQAQSKEKTLAKMERAGLTKKVSESESDRRVVLDAWLWHTTHTHKHATPFPSLFHFLHVGRACRHRCWLTG